jgi:hypothetical protein
VRTFACTRCGNPAHFDNARCVHCGAEHATMHPSEDWAETFAHVLHVRDAMQTAAYGLTDADPPVRRCVDELARSR